MMHAASSWGRLHAIGSQVLLDKPVSFDTCSAHARQAQGLTLRTLTRKWRVRPRRSSVPETLKLEAKQAGLLALVCLACAGESSGWRLDEEFPDVLIHDITLGPMEDAFLAGMERPASVAAAYRPARNPPRTFLSGLQ